MNVITYKPITYRIYVRTYMAMRSRSEYGRKHDDLGELGDESEVCDD